MIKYFVMNTSDYNHYIKEWSSQYLLYFSHKFSSIMIIVLIKIKFSGFIVVAACVMTFEARDSAAKVTPARPQTIPRPLPRRGPCAPARLDTLGVYRLPHVLPLPHSLPLAPVRVRPHVHRWARFLHIYVLHYICFMSSVYKLIYIHRSEYCITCRIYISHS